MMAALLKYQGKDGMWRQLIDHDDAWPESSSSAMFTFAMITGVKNGWLDAATYGPAARKRMDRRRRLHRSEQRCDQCLRRHRQVKRPRLLPGPPSPHRRFPRPGSGSLGSLRTVTLDGFRHLNASGARLLQRKILQLATTFSARIERMTVLTRTGTSTMPTNPISRRLRAFWDFFVLFSGISTASNLSRTRKDPVRRRGLFLFRKGAKK